MMLLINLIVSFAAAILFLQGITLWFKNKVTNAIACVTGAFMLIMIISSANAIMTTQTYLKSLSQQEQTTQDVVPPYNGGENL